MKNQKGQSLVEVGILLSFVIAPLMLLLPYFSKVIEARHYNDMSARYIAFEKTVWLENGPKNYKNSGNGRLAIKQTPAIKNEIPRRLFSKLSIPIDSRSINDEEWNSLDHGYSTFNFNQSKKASSQSLFAAYNPDEEDSTLHRFFEVETTNKKAPGSISSFIDTALSLLEIGGTNFNGKGFFKGKSELQIASHLLLEEEEGREKSSEQAGRETKRESEFEIIMASNLYILADGWNVGGPKHNVGQVKGLVPSSIFDFGPLNQLRGLVSQVPIAAKLGPDDLRFGHIAIEELPEGRYRDE